MIVWEPLAAELFRPLPETVTDVAFALAHEIVVVPGAGHFFHGQLMLLKSLVLRNFAE